VRRVTLIAAIAVSDPSSLGIRGRVRGLVGDRASQPPVEQETFWRPPPAGSRAGGFQLPSVVATLSAIITVVVGLTALVYIFGGVVLWIRLHREHFPADSVVTSLPRELVIGVGLKSVIVPTVGLAIVAAIGLVLVTVSLRLGKGIRTRGTIALVVGAILFTMLFVAFRGSWWALAWIAVACAAYFLALGVGYRLKLHRSGYWTPATIAIWAAVLGIVGAGFRILLEWNNPSLEQAVICVNDGGTKYDGLLIGETGEAVYLGQGEQADRVVISIPTGRIEELWIGSKERACSRPSQIRDGPSR
jgi:hypothetical protein